MEIRWLPRKSRRKTRPAKPNGWKRSPLIGARVPQSKAHVWRLGPGQRELERVTDRSGKPVVLHSHAKVDALEEVIPRPGFYRVVLRSREGHICGRRDFQADWRFPSYWTPETARARYEPKTTEEKLAAERDGLKAELDAAKARIATLSEALEAANRRIGEVQRNAEIRVEAVRVDAAERIGDAARNREALEVLVARQDAELRRVRGLYTALADDEAIVRRVSSRLEPELDDEAEHELGAEEPPDVATAPEGLRRPKRRPKDYSVADFEKLADVVIRIGERLGLVQPEGEEDDEDEDEDDVD